MAMLQWYNHIYSQFIEMKNSATTGMRSGALIDENEEEEIARAAFASFQAREEEIEKKKMMVKEKVELKLGRAEEETRRLAQVWEELEVLTDPMRKEVAMVRKKIDVANREVRSLGQSCQKKGSGSTKMKMKNEVIKRMNENGDGSVGVGSREQERRREGKR
ncbi:uncharacterized protein LOC110912603 isoform X2 [Helianthus annuus]|uniref:uncharacterized protein LOC110912603 isoform X2 n=1 Tax=Helianthus annuus TaxID=4232 RepID=UPI0016533E56|nr:uncharacterized protein LOC110912603 isoform X2 [Helianthus annuus]